MNAFRNIFATVAIFFFVGLAVAPSIAMEDVQEETSFDEVILGGAYTKNM